MSGQAGPNVKQKIDQNQQIDIQRAEAEKERQRRAQEAQALQAQRAATLRGTQLGNVQTARNMSKRPSPFDRIPEGARRHLPPEAWTNPGSIPHNEQVRIATEAVGKWKAQPNQPSTADRRLEFDQNKFQLEQDQQAEQRAQEQAEDQQREANKSIYAKEKLATVNTAVDDALKIVKENPVASGGFIGGINSNIPGTDSYNLQSYIDTLQSNLSFDELQRMRDASKSGGALGSVSERELQLLGSTVASLDTGADREIIMKNLEKVREHYNKFLGSLEGDAQEVTTQEQFDALPSGAVYMEDGKQYRKP